MGVNGNQMLVEPPAGQQRYRTFALALFLSSRGRYALTPLRHYVTVS